MEFLLEALFQFVGEILLQILFEAIAEFGFHSVKETLKRPKNPFVATAGFFLWGALAGGISLLIFPLSFIASTHLRLLNLLVTPIAAGGIMGLLGKLRQRRGQVLVGLDRFFYAFAFALAMALVRYFLAKGPV